MTADHPGKKTFWTMLAIVFAWGMFSIFSGETIPVHEGCGYDGVIYADTAMHFDALFKNPVPDKRIQRFIPSGIVYGALKLLRMPLTMPNISRGFKGLNFVLLLASVWIFSRSADRMGLGTVPRWVAFTAIFVNFASVKMPYYNPVLTDTSGFFLGMLLFYFFTADSAPGMFFTALAGAFTWPTVPYYALLLMCFKKTPSGFPRIPFWVRAALSAVFTGVFFWALQESFVRLGGTFLTGINDPGTGSIRVDPALAAVSTALSLLFLFLTMVTFLSDGRWIRPSEVLKEFRPARFLAMALLFAGVLWLLHVSPPPVASSPMKSDYLTLAVQVTLTRCIALPLIYILSHIIYFGPIVYVIIFYWKNVCEEISSLGMGLGLCFLMNLTALVPNS